ncbi:MAG TPA: hypothetical protein VEB63_05835 [Chitinophagaceae bacterium]|nr:hypothetical protein [Chitinophagaceae bacterium]
MNRPEHNRKPAPKKKKVTSKQKVREHLRNRHHVITDEDIRDVVIGPEAVDLDAQREHNPDARVEDASEKLKKEIPEDKKTTPWDLLGE